MIDDKMFALHNAFICPAANKKPALSIWLRAGWICLYHARGTTWLGSCLFAKERSSPTLQARKMLQHKLWDIIDALPPGNGGLPARTTGNSRSSRIAAHSQGQREAFHAAMRGRTSTISGSLAAHARMYSSLVTTTSYAICQV